MCGINGVFGYHREVKDGTAVIAAMNSKIAHRGPDDRGSWKTASGDLHVGHLRLSILDLTPEGHQPMISPSGTVLIFNGEIFNFKELKNQFFKDEKFHSSTDTEVLLKLYERFGEDCLHYLNGMFAFAIWDPKLEQLLFARDRAGKKPLYYSNSGGYFTFSSEIKALLCCPWMERELDEEALYHFLTFNMLAPPLTMFKGIAKLAPGQKMVVNRSGDIRISSYWNVEYDSNADEKSESEWKDLVFEGLENAVRYRMVSDVPVGAFLSGGVDSSAIVAMMSGMTKQTVKTYSVGFKGQEGFNELSQARFIAERYKTEHHETIISPEEMEAFLPQMIDVYDEPLADATGIPIWFISKAARENGTIVVMTGDGSDELFAGYRNWRKYIHLFPYFEKLKRLPLPLRKVLLGCSRVLSGESNRTEMLQRAVRDQDFFWGGARSFKESVKSGFLSDDFKKRLTVRDSYPVIASFRKEFDRLSSSSSRSFTHVDWMCYLGFRYIVPNYYLYRMDHIGMAHSIEVRTPFLDYHMVNLSLSVPSRFKLVNEEPKYILKKSLERILPDEILYRQKMGFNVPLKQWAGSWMIRYIEENLYSFCEKHSQFNFSALKVLLERLKQGDESSVNRLWTLYFLIAWFKKWMD